MKKFTAPQFTNAMKLPNEIYLDANFLIAYFVGNHTDHNASKVLFFNLLQQDCVTYISTLGLDEAWFKVYEVLQKDIPKDKRKPIKEFYSEIKQILGEIRKLPQNIKIVQFENDFETGIKQTVENIGSFNFHPRDAFHLAYMQDLNLQTIITKDKTGFGKVLNLQVISY